MTTTLNREPPPSPASKETEKAFYIFCSAQRASASFLDQFEGARKARGARGIATDAEQDLLRAMVLFASAGLDSLVKQLVRDALPEVVERDEGATQQFRDRAEKYVVRGDVLDASLVVSALTSHDPRQVLMDRLVEELTSSSLQSAEQLFKVAAFFNLPTSELVSHPQELKDVFAARNEISHEMDVDFDQPRRNRRTRPKANMVRYTNTLLATGRRFLEHVDSVLTAGSLAG